MKENNEEEDALVNDFFIEHVLFYDLSFFSRENLWNYSTIQWLCKIF